MREGGREGGRGEGGEYCMCPRPSPILRPPRQTFYPDSYLISAYMYLIVNSDPYQK